MKVFFAHKVDQTNVTSAVSRPQLTHAITTKRYRGLGGAQIPALEEARGFLPEWVAIEGCGWVGRGYERISGVLRSGTWYKLFGHSTFSASASMGPPIHFGSRFSAEFSGPYHDVPLLVNNLRFCQHRSRSLTSRRTSRRTT